MGKRLVCLTSCVLVLGLAGNAFSGLLGDPSLVIYYDFETCTWHILDGFHLLPCIWDIF